MSRRPSPPGRAVVFGLLAVAGLLAIVASAQPWWQARAEGADVAFSGPEATGGLSQALAVVLLAGLLLGLALQARGRRMLAVLLGLAAVGAVVVGGWRVQPSSPAVRAKVRQVTLADQFDLTATGWPWVYLGAGVLALVGALLLAWAATSWPRRTPRFERFRSGVPATSHDDVALADDPSAAWQALDAGLDPTAPPGDAPSPDPGVRRGRSGDTMDANPGTQPES